MSDSPPLAARGRSLLRQALAMGQTRLEMLGLEIEQEKLLLARELRLVALIVLCAGLGGFTLVLWVALSFPARLRFWVLGALVLVFAVAAAAGWLHLKRVARRERLFARVIAQLRLDGVALGDEE
ncbi:MAG TPA: phage holin family protein [Steroidobacteraceae bacterium]|nr:phage holin family protein [Steroidobacteraceae bacterium]